MLNINIDATEKLEEKQGDDIGKSDIHTHAHAHRHVFINVATQR